MGKKKTEKNHETIKAVAATSNIMVVAKIPDPAHPNRTASDDFPVFVFGDVELEPEPEPELELELVPELVGKAVADTVTVPLISIQEETIASITA